MMPNSVLRLGCTTARVSLRDASSQLLLGQVFTAVVALLANVAAARELGPSGRGELALLLQTGYLLGIVLLYGTDKSGVAALGGPNASGSARAYWQLIRAPLAGTAFLILLAILFARSLDLPWMAAAALALVFAASNALARTVRSIAIADQKTLNYLRVTFAGQLILLVLVLLCSFLRLHSLWWVGAYAAAGLLTSVPVLRLWVIRDNESLSGTIIKKVRREGLVLLPSALATSGMLRADRLFLPLLSSTQALGLYAGVATFTELVSWPLVAFADSRVGRWRALADRQHLSIKRMLLAWAAFSLCGGAVISFALLLTIEPLFGPEFASSRALVPILVVAAGLFGMSRLLQGALIAHRRSGLSSVAETGGFVVSVILYLALIPTYSAGGAAWGSLAGYFASFVLALIFFVVCTRGETQK